jgi:glycolate oxidase FAD binding subunit
MNTLLTPGSVAELAEAVRTTPRVLAVGAQTKPRLSAVDCVKLSTTKLSGIVEYEPSEFTFTARAGTPVREIAAVLAERGQYLPFDPLLVDAGATLGGTVAAGLSGPGRFRFGGLRDFILGVQFIDGLGRVLRLGGKVVKNAAGFDVPKFMVGSLGRFGIMTEITFKVFPAPASRLTLTLEVGSPQSALTILTTAANSRWELDALDAVPGGRSVALRLGGPAPALETLAREILARWPGRRLTEAEADALWLELRECRWADDRAPLIKVALAPGNLPAIQETMSALPGARAHISAGGNVAFVSLATAEQVAPLDQALQEHQLCGVTLRGDASLWLGRRMSSRISAAVKTALDPESRFPSLDD